MNNQLAPTEAQGGGPVQKHRQWSDRQNDAIEKARAARRRIVPRPIDPLELYDRTLSNLRRAIRAGWESDARFCEDVGLDKFHLAKCWPNSTKAQPTRGDRRQEIMGVGVFSRICLALGLLENCEVTDEQLLSSISLLDYLRCNNHALNRCLLDLTDLSI